MDELNVALRPLVADLRRLKLDEFLGTTDFERLILSIGIERDWSNTIVGTKQRGYFKGLDDVKIRSRTFESILGHYYDNNHNLFTEFLGSLIETLFEWGKFPSGEFHMIREDLKLTSFPIARIYLLEARINRIGRTGESPGIVKLPGNKSVTSVDHFLIFISHSSKDKIVVNNFVQIVLRLGLEIDLNQIFCSSVEGMGIKTGRDFREEIKDKMANSGLVIILLSENYKKSEMCLNEMGAAWVLNKHVIPILIPPLDHSEVGILRITDQIDKIDTVAGLDNIAHTIKDLLNLSVNLPNWGKHKDDFLKSINRDNENRNEQISENEQVSENDLIMKEFRVKEHDAATLIWHLGSNQEFKNRTQKTLEKKTGFNASKIDEIIRKYPSIFYRSIGNKTGSPIYRLHDSAKQKFLDKILSRIP